MFAIFWQTKCVIPYDSYLAGLDCNLGGIISQTLEPDAICLFVWRQGVLYCKFHSWFATQMWRGRILSILLTRVQRCAYVFNIGVHNLKLTSQYNLHFCFSILYAFVFFVSHFSKINAWIWYGSITSFMSIIIYVDLWGALEIRSKLAQLSGFFFYLTWACPL